ncbi:hypothetical protein SEVIR_9G102200v4 [Setaria viridis]|uniref:Uncharacterized protein n=2 Tax=Setaria TaxID=4554 RepID=A0A368SFC1_SETIT|nr:hypothetical protein SETIT_9G104400v2 [Setaria italica]TKV91525.1 hypothetical protein SEVIR_9G102200v2 [Setaria viridis]
MAGVGKLGQWVKLLVVVVLVVSASDGARASRPLKGTAVAPSAAGGQHSSNGGLLASVKLAVVSKASAGHSSCTWNPNNSGGPCP